MSDRDRDRIFHEAWLGLAQPIEGLVFSIPALADAQIAPSARPEITAALRAELVELPSGKLALASVRRFFESFLGYGAAGALIERGELPTFYAPESGQEVRASFGIARAASAPSDDPFAEFATPASGAQSPGPPSGSPILALVWDLGDDAPDAPALDLDASEEVTGPWRYPPTAKLERLLRHSGIPVGFVSNRRELRLVYAPAGETTSHVTFRFNDLADPAGRPLALALELLFHARRTYGADARYTFAGLLAESRRRQADVTEKLALQVKEAVETLLAGFEAASTRDAATDRSDWLRAAMEEGHVYEGILDTVLRLVFVLYAEDRSLLPVDNPLYAEHLSAIALYERLLADAGAHPESMHQRYGAYGALTSLFRAIYFGVRHGSLHLPPRQGKLFDPSAYPFLEGGLPGWTAAVHLAEDRAEVALPSVDDRTVFEVLHGLIVLDGQRLSYRDLSVEQIGAVYESLMGYRVLRLEGPAARLGKNGVWVEMAALRSASRADQKKLLEETCDLSAAAIKNVNAVLGETTAAADDAAADAIAALWSKKDRLKNRARAAQLVLQPTESRRSTGSHYTPRSLSERVVQRTLEPLLKCLGEAPTASRILELKICDPAMGSGAFLVAACRYLADQIVEAWRRSGELPAMIELHGNAERFAKRLVAERCLYGVDKNPAAVELAKLSLWLETMSADRSFTFLDHVLRHGDSLVGLDLEQIRAFHWTPEEQTPTIRKLLDDAIVEVREHREQIQVLAEDESEFAQREKRRLLEIADLAMERVKLVADACVGAFFSGDKPKAREEERRKRLDVVEIWLRGAENLRAQIEAWSREIRELHAPFHWHLELPEVFFLERPDPLEEERVNGAAFVDAFVGNPPFLGYKFISGSLGNAYKDWLFTAHPGSGGNADLCAHFFRRSNRLLGENGTMGLVATNSIAEGDTRESSLGWMVRDGCRIYAADRSLPWPGVANVSIAIVHVERGSVRATVRSLDGCPASEISSSLRTGQERSAATRLSANAGLAFLGSTPLGTGFLITPEERSELLRMSTRNGERIFEYVGGEDMTNGPKQYSDRLIISFGTMSLGEAQAWPALLGIVEERVKPERDRLRDDNSAARFRKAHWWRFAGPAEDLYRRLAGLDRCLVAARVSKFLCFAFQPIGRVFANTVVVIPNSSTTFLGILQSRVHEVWVRETSSTLEDRLSYSTSDSFETFPLPRPDPQLVIPLLETIGERLCADRARYMVDTDQGLTKTYNHLKDPACDDPRILALRTLHEEMDRAVLDAYGWADVAVPPFCIRTPDEERALEQFKEAVIDRLFALNAARAEEERRLGQAKPAKGARTKPAAKAKPAARATKKLPKGATEAEQPDLFDNEEP